MKPIPEALRAYFPDRWCSDRPWWKASWQDDVNDFTFKRPDGYGTALLSDREEIDRAHPMQPPPILVGQVWAYTLPAHPDTTVVVQLLRIVLHTDRRDAVFGTDDFFATAPDLLAHGFLLSCPYGYAPWSGPEVPK